MVDESSCVRSGPVYIGRMNKNFRVYKGLTDIGRITVMETGDVVIAPTILAADGVDLNTLVGAVLETCEGPYATGRVGDLGFFLETLRG